MKPVENAVCGINVTTSSISACVRELDAAGANLAGREFGMSPEGVDSLVSWLESRNVRHVAVDSPGNHWKPLWNALEGSFDLYLAHRGCLTESGLTDDRDAGSLIAELLQEGRLRTNYVPDSYTRQLRDLTRFREELIQTSSILGSKIQNVLSESDISAVSARPDADSRSIKQLARVISDYIPEKDASLLAGGVSPHDSFMLTHLAGQLKDTEGRIMEVSARIRDLLKEREPFIQKLMQIPGMVRRNAENIIAETGFDLARFETSDDLAMWAGFIVAKGAKMPHYGINGKSGKQWLRRALAEAAQPVAAWKSSPFADVHRYLQNRVGNRRAMETVSRLLLDVVYELIASNRYFSSLPGSVFTRYMLDS